MAIRIKFDDREKARLEQMLLFERDLYASGAKYIAGIDEVGRGPLAGPVVAAAVILPQGILIPGVNDSKKLSAAKREYLYHEICERAIAVGIGMADEKIIDRINILNATKMAMKEAVGKLSFPPDFLLLDAVHLDGVDIPQKSLIKGDTLSLSIAAASIVAKVTRDKLLCEFNKIYPGYNFEKHKGYGTKEHIEHIKALGLSPIHRRSFTKKILEELKNE